MYESNPGAYLWEIWDAVVERRVMNLPALLNRSGSLQLQDEDMFIDPLTDPS